jgi:hypothetical protein
MQIDTSKLLSWSKKGYIGATILMEQIVSVFHIPMRQAKVIIEKAIVLSAPFDEVTYDALCKVLADEDMRLPITKVQVTSWQDPYQGVSLMKSYGGPGKNSMKTMHKKLKAKLSSHHTWLVKQQQFIDRAKLHLQQAIEALSKGGEYYE